MPSSRTLLIASCLALVFAVGCGGSAGPTSPSSTGGTGAVIAGTVNGGGAGLTVSVAGANLSAAVEDAGNFQIADVPTGNVQLQFRNAAVTATAQVSNVASNQFINIQVQLNGTTATIVNESRSEKVILCHSTGNGSYHSIDVSVEAEPAHRAHGDGKVGDPVPAEPTKTFDANCRPVGPSVEITKFTNGADANEPPGPSITVGSPVTWQYVVSNTGTINLTGITVVDDRGVSVNCNGQTTLAPGATMTCTATGVATLGQYRNVGTVRANWSTSSGSGTVNDSDVSHYLGVSPDDEEGPKVQLCHRTGAGFYVLIEVSVNAEPAHRAHGDGKVGDPVPGNAGRVFGPGCQVQ
jgi:hypothetical protein